MFAARYAYLDIVQLLVEKGAKLLNPNPQCYGALHAACYGGDEEVIKYLIIKAKYPLHKERFEGTNIALSYDLEKSSITLRPPQVNKNPIEFKVPPEVLEQFKEHRMDEEMKI